MVLGLVHKEPFGYKKVLSIIKSHNYFKKSEKSAWINREKKEKTEDKRVKLSKFISTKALALKAQHQNIFVVLICSRDCNTSHLITSKCWF